MTDQEIDSAFEGTHFGENSSNKEILLRTLLKCACNYHSGSTATHIVKGLGLVQNNKWSLTAKGMEYLYDNIEPFINEKL